MDNVEDIIKSRHSVREYLSKEIESEKVDRLNETIESINKEEQLNIQLVINNPEAFDKFILHYGRLKNASNYIALIGRKTENLEEKIGYSGEKIVLIAQSLGLNTCWVAGTYSKGNVKAIINSGEKLVCIIAIGYGANQGVNRKMKSFSDVSLSTDVPNWYRRGVEFALYSPTAMNEQKYKFELISERKVMLKPGIGPMTRIDKGIVKYHFELGAGKENFEWA
ncbi:MAG: nitroreductase [Clostridia bacterium]|nr:nitroreductase [Clostridia bacterium]